MPDTDVILVTELPEFEVIGDHFQFVIVSGTRRRIFRMPLHRARNATMAAWGILRREDERPINVAPLRAAGG